MTNIVISESTTSQYQEILALHRLTFEAHQKVLPDRFFSTDDSPEESLLRSGLDPSNKNSFLLTAIFEGQFSGYIHCYLAPVDTGNKTHDLVGAIIDICVHPNYCNQGLGLALVKAGEKAMRQKGATRLLANVWRGNEASYRLFQKAGFEIDMTEFGKRVAPQNATPLPNTDRPRWRNQAYSSFIFIVVGFNVLASGYYIWITVLS